MTKIRVKLTYKTKKIKYKVGKMTKKIEKMKIAEKEVFLKIARELGIPKKFYVEVEEQVFKSKTSFKTQDKSKKISVVGQLYEKEMNKISYILSRDDLLKKIKGIKILVSGKTGTGKTTMINELIEKMPEYKLHKMIVEEMISSKMGQTQLNIISLQQELKNTKKNILFIDEVDSIISNRFDNKDLSEYHRITSSFIKLLDSLDENTITIFSTNLKEKIDPAIIRRMNFMIEGKEMEINNFITNLKLEAPIDWTPQQENKIMNIFKDSLFTISELNWFKNEFEIEKAMNNINKEYAFFIKKFLNKEKMELTLSSKRMKEDLIREGVIINDL